MKQVLSARAHGECVLRTQARYLLGGSGDRQIAIPEGVFAGIYPISRALECDGVHERLRTLALQPLPVTGGLAVGMIHRIRADVFNGSTIVLLGREMTRTNAKSCDRKSPIAKGHIVLSTESICAPSGSFCRISSIVS